MPAAVAEVDLDSAAVVADSLKLVESRAEVVEGPVVAVVVAAAAAAKEAVGPKGCADGPHGHSRQWRLLTVARGRALRHHYCHNLLLILRSEQAGLIGEDSVWEMRGLRRLF